MRKAGARTIGQDESTCVVYGMPKVAYDIGAVEYQEKLFYMHPAFVIQPLRIHLRKPRRHMLYNDNARNIYTVILHHGK